MTRVVEIRTGSRLHFGLFDTRSSAGRQGGVGMMVDRPSWLLRAHRTESDEIIADPESAARIQSSLEKLADLRTAQGGIRIEVHSTIPPHRGFGSGTQLSLALAKLLDEMGMLSPGNVAPALGRGTRSLVGTIGFSLGGFVIDPGERSILTNSNPRAVAIPEQWRFVIIEPTDADDFSGATETDAFGGLAPMSGQTRDRLARLVEQNIVPAIERNNFTDFAAATSAFNRLVGEQFAPAQGGIYAHPAIRKLAEMLGQTECPHLAQSSWGAAAAVFCPSDESAGRLATSLENRLDGSSVTIRQAEPLNQGVVVVTQ